MRATLVCLLLVSCSGSHAVGGDGGVSPTADMSLPGYPAVPAQMLSAPMGAMENYGIIIAVSGDGNTLATCGALEGVASLLIYTRSGSTYGAMPTQTLSTPENVESFCGALGISNDGSTLAVGGVDGTSMNSAVAIFTRAAGMYPMEPDQVVVTMDMGLPWSAALSGDGNTLATSSNVGAGVYVYTRTAAMFPTMPTQTLTRPSTGTPQFGSAVTISGDGSRLLAANGAVGGSGAKLFIYDRANGTYGAATEFDAPAATTGSFATSLSLRADGRELAEGGDLPVHMSIYAPSGNTYAFVESVPVPAGAPSNFFPAVALTSDGTLIVGSFETEAILVYPPA